MSRIGTSRALAMFAVAAGLTIAGCDVNSPDIDAAQVPSPIETAGDALVADSGGGGGTSDVQAPSAPSNLRAWNVTGLSATLSWTASTDDVGVVFYDIYNAGTLMGSIRTTNVTVFNLIAGTTYSFTVRARDGAGNVSPDSNLVTVIPVTGGGGGGGIGGGGGGGSTTSGCKVTYTTSSQWRGFRGTIAIKNTGSSPWTSWQLTWTWPGSQSISSLWGGTFTQRGASVTVTNLGSNGNVAAGGSVNGIGFMASGTAATPSSFSVNGVTCK
jgi:chitodextrinase